MITVYSPPLRGKRPLYRLQVRAILEPHADIARWHEYNDRETRNLMVDLLVLAPRPLVLCGAVLLG